MFGRYHNPYSQPEPSYGYGYGGHSNPYYAMALAEQQRRKRLQEQRDQAQRDAQIRLMNQARQQRARAQAYLPHEYGFGDDEDDGPLYDYGLGGIPAFSRREPGLPSQPPTQATPSARRPSPPTDAHHSRDRSPAQSRKQALATEPPMSSPSSSAPPPTAIPRAPTEAEEAAATKIQHSYRIHRSLRAIDALDHVFQNTKEQFVFPTTIDFQDPHNSERSISVPVTPASPLSSSLSAHDTARLAFTANNRPLHAYLDSLSRILTSLDGIESWGKASVRQRRKQVVQKIEHEIQEVEGVDASEERSEEELLKGWRGVWRWFVSSPPLVSEVKDANSDDFVGVGEATNPDPDQ